MTATHFKIATRKSPLALWQAEYVQQKLQQKYPELTIELVKLVTAGDRVALQANPPTTNGKSLFVKELQTALLEGRADIAVHSIKDCSVHPVPGLSLTAICEREDPRDALVSLRADNLFQLPIGARVGTASPRRQCQLAALRSDLQIIPLRGNVGSRLTKLDNNDFDALILASAGLKRLQLLNRISQFLDPQQFIPAIGQGALGIECREEDERTINLVAHLNHAATYYCVSAERAMNQHLGGDCYAPVAAYATFDSANNVAISAMVGTLDGRLILKENISGSATDFQALGIELAERLLSLGAAKILGELY